MANKFAILVSAIFVAAYASDNDDVCNLPSCQKYGQVFPNCQDCSSYFRCTSNGNVKELVNCPYGQYFNVRTSQCGPSKDYCPVFRVHPDVITIKNKYDMEDDDGVLKKVLYQSDVKGVLNGYGKDYHVQLGASAVNVLPSGSCQEFSFVNSAITLYWQRGIGRVTYFDGDGKLTSVCLAGPPRSYPIYGRYYGRGYSRGYGHGRGYGYDYGYSGRYGYRYNGDDERHGRYYGPPDYRYNYRYGYGYDRDNGNGNGDNGNNGYGDNSRSGYGDNGRNGYGDNGRNGYGDNGRNGYGDNGNGYGDNGYYDRNDNQNGHDEEAGSCVTQLTLPANTVYAIETVSSYFLFAKAVYDSDSDSEDASLEYILRNHPDADRNVVRRLTSCSRNLDNLAPTFRGIVLGGIRAGFRGDDDRDDLFDDLFDDIFDDVIDDDDDFDDGNGRVGEPFFADRREFGDRRYAPYPYSYGRDRYYRRSYDRSYDRRYRYRYGYRGYGRSGYARRYYEGRNFGGRGPRNNNGDDNGGDDNK